MMGRHGTGLKQSKVCEADQPRRIMLPVRVLLVVCGEQRSAVAFQRELRQVCEHKALR